MHFLAIFGMLAVLATSVTSWYSYFGACDWSCCDSICLLGYGRTLLQYLALPRAGYNPC